MLTLVAQGTSRQTGAAGSGHVLTLYVLKCARTWSQSMASVIFQSPCNAHVPAACCHSHLGTCAGGAADAGGSVRRLARDFQPCRQLPGQLASWTGRTNTSTLQRWAVARLGTASSAAERAAPQDTLPVASWVVVLKCAHVHNHACVCVALCLRLCADEQRKD